MSDGMQILDGHVFSADQIWYKVTKGPFVLKNFQIGIVVFLTFSYIYAKENLTPTPLLAAIVFNRLNSFEHSK